VPAFSSGAKIDSVGGGVVREERNPKEKIKIVSVEL
jgi:hypothetical protein